MHDGMAIEVTSSSALVRSPCQNYSDYKVGTNGYGGSVRVLSWSRSVGTWTEPNTEHVLAMVSCMFLLGQPSFQIVDFHTTSPRIQELWIAVELCGTFQKNIFSQDSLHVE